MTAQAETPDRFVDPRPSRHELEEAADLIERQQKEIESLKERLAQYEAAKLSVSADAVRALSQQGEGK